MAIMTCGRCGKQTAKVQDCTYCKKALCYSCVKSSKKLRKVKTLYICKSCWSNMRTRGVYKSA